jgi:hypothetical protein
MLAATIEAACAPGGAMDRMMDRKLVAACAEGGPIQRLLAEENAEMDARMLARLHNGLDLQINGSHLCLALS